ncbi:alpha/beta hydrolase [Oscillatoria sp. CS-180]|uniref:alpha/beta hydrolase n=1 Tax=Oscillatoria sp. CS-180 TaxID=3021720 RepID=UPI00232F79A9|nr:alpha/beta hydrolase [Oscillatoria sp. CS-180]MDB9525956.1 alpha/beta hydrolase [Oscillatoria sp. CS-180]
MVLKAITKVADNSADKLFIGLHGWGANAADLATLADYMPLPGFKMVFPDAPFPHPYAPGGKMWYGFPVGYDFQTAPDFEPQADLQESRQMLTHWLKALFAETGIPPERTAIAGFSQGGAMTMDIGLQFPLAGALVLSGYLHSRPTPHAALGPVLMVHGRQDPVVPIQQAHISRNALQELAIDLTYREYDMGHEISPLVLRDVMTFCQNLPFE